MVLVDVNLLIHAVNVDFPDHLRAKIWLEGLLQRQETVGLPWAVLVAFVRITTNPRAMARPFTLDEAPQLAHEWLRLPSVVVLHPASGHETRFAALCRAASAAGNLVTDAHLAALAMEHNCEMASNDTDFARFPGLRWFNPLDTPQPRP